MARSRVFGFLAIAMCLVAFVCVCAEATKEEAEAAVAEVKALASKALRDARDGSKSAYWMFNRVQRLKRVAEEAAAEAAKAGKENKKTEGAAAEVKEALDEVIALYADANKATDAALKGMQKLMEKAEKLNKEAIFEELSNSDSESDYTQVQEKAREVKGKVAKLQGKIEESKKLLHTARAAEDKMAEAVEMVELSNYRVFIMDESDKIDRELEKADIAIRSAEQKRDETDKALKEIKKLLKNVPKNLSDYANMALGFAEGNLKTASKAVDDAKKAKEEILGLKNYTDTSLAKVKKESDLQKVVIEARYVRQSAEEVRKKAFQIESALQSAKSAATDAESVKQAFMTISSKDYSVITASFFFLLALILCATLH